MLYTAFFLLLLISCANDTIWDTAAIDIRKQLAIGDYSSLDRMTDTELTHAVNLDPRAPFFIARYLLDSDKLEMAAKILISGAKKCPTPYNRLCLFLLIQNSPPTDVITYANQYNKKWPNDRAVQAALANAYVNTEDYQKVLQIAVDSLTIREPIAKILDTMAITKEDAILVGCFLYAQLMKDGTEIKDETSYLLNQYFERFPVTNEYKRIATAFPTQIAQAQIFATEKYYDQASTIFTNLFKTSPEYLYNDRVLSNAGKSFLYSNTLETTADDIWRKLPTHYITLFYSGRLAAKHNNHKEAVSFFEASIKETTDSKQQDHALWYLLQETSLSNFDSIPSIFAKYQNNIADASYFSDFFESYITKAIQRNKWNSIADLYYRCENSFDTDTAARIAFLTAYGIETGKITLLPSDTRRFSQQSDEMLRKQLITTAYTTVYMNTHNTFYYRIKAGERLGQSVETATLFKYTVVKKQEEKKPDNESGMPESLLTAEDRIRGYLDYGLKNRAYQEILANGDTISTDTLLGYSQEYRDRYNDYQKSIRLAVYALSTPDRPVTKDDMRAAYPLYYKDEINAACYLYQLEPVLLCGLIRTESYFNHKVVSSAGAIGLTQLMTPTAADIARKLKKIDYNLTDPVTNITFGAFYLAELLRRLDGNVQDAIFSYNGGISRVRSWRKTIKVPDDTIFLEVIPIEETRDYGRKVLAATAVYRYLYDIE